MMRASPDSWTMSRQVRQAGRSQIVLKKVRSATELGRFVSCRPMLASKPISSKHVFPVGFVRHPHDQPQAVSQPCFSCPAKVVSKMSCRSSLSSSKTTTLTPASSRRLIPSFSLTNVSGSRIPT